MEWKKGGLAVLSILIGLMPQGAWAAGDPVQAIFNGVNRDSLWTTLRELTGDLPVQAGGATFRISERYTPAGKANFRKFWLDQYRKLGMSVSEQAFPANKHAIERVGEKEAHNVEAVLPGKSADSVVIVVHYDSMGELGHETENPAVDDDMTGMAIQMETARLLSALTPSQRAYTVRFVAVDLEEVGGLAGSRNYASALKARADQEGFNIIAAIDDEQTGWNCAREGACDGRADALQFDVFSCSGEERYNFPALGDAIEGIANKYSNLKTARACMGENSDHYAFWEIGVPAVVFSEHSPFLNPHFDRTGGDTIDKIDPDYFFRIAQVGAAFAAKTAGVAP